MFRKKSVMNFAIPQVEMMGEMVSPYKSPQAAQTKRKNTEQVAQSSFTDLTMFPTHSSTPMTTTKLAVVDEKAETTS